MVTLTIRRLRLGSRQVRYRIDDLQRAPDEAGQFNDIERVGAAAGRIFAAVSIRRVIVEVVEFIEKCASGMLLAGIAEILNDPG